MAMEDNGGTKRRKSEPERVNIFDLPDALLAKVAKYLPRPSVAMLAVAMTPAPSLQDVGAGPAVALLSNSDWEVLNFDDVERSLSSKLSDDDVRAILSCIDAPNKLRRLELTGCVNITGSGLEPLRGSSVLELIDLSLLGQHEGSIDDEDKDPMKHSMISEQVVLPILDTIVESSCNSLRYIQLPKKWRVRKKKMLRDFLARYDSLLQGRRLHCKKCNTIPTREDNRSCIELDVDGCYGLQLFTCFICTETFCYDCNREGLNAADDEQRMLSECGRCEKDYCADCLPRCCEVCFERCGGCIKYCSQCNDAVCDNCYPRALPCDCSGCGQFYCESCHVNFRRCCDPCLQKSRTVDKAEIEKLRRQVEELLHANERLCQQNNALRRQLKI